MKIFQELNAATRDQGTMTLALFVCLFCLGFGGELLANELAVPAEFVRYIKLPGLGETIERPNALHYDRFNDEILVADTGTNRIIIFSATGVFRYSFSLVEVMANPRDVTTDHRGFIYVLGSDSRGTLVHRFDFDGVSLGDVEFPRVQDGKPVELRYLACDDEGVLYALDHSGRRIIGVGDEDDVVMVIQLDRLGSDSSESEEVSADGGSAYALGTLTCVGNTLYVPISNVGTVVRYSTDGEFLGSIGHFGAKPGTLNFPVAVDVSPEGMIMVLDRNRYCVVCYSPDNQFLGEFGGRGYTPGWFIGPAFLAVPSTEWAIVGQLYQSRIQVCAVPEFIRAKINSEQATEDLGESRASGSVNNPSGISQRRLSDISGPIGITRDGEFPPSISTGAHEAHTVSYPEVSE